MKGRIMEKKSEITEGQRKKLIYSAILSAAAMAGIGAIVKDNKAKKARQKAKDVHSSRNAIVIPIKKSRFMEGLPTPDEHAEMFGGKQMQIGYSQPASLPSPISDANSGDKMNSMSPEEIASRKKEILNGRKVDFFKKASENKKDDEGKKDEKDKDIPEVKVEEKEDRVLYRDQDGKFVSPTDPIAVEQVKKADILPELNGWSDLVLHPFDTASRAFGEMKELPMWIAGGMLGSSLLAGLIADAINERRRERSKERLENERAKYVDLLEGSEKSAESGMHVGDFSGALIGSAFAIPAVLTAMITNRIIENRREEKKKKKEMSDSYPEDPIILYKTSEDKEIGIDPSTALMLIMVKKAMIMEAEMAEAKLVKRAQGFDDPMPYLFNDRQSPSAHKYSDEEYNKAIDYAVGHMTSDENRGKLLDLIKLKVGKGSDKDQKKLVASMLPGRLGLNGFFGFTGAPENFMSIANTPEFKARLAQSGKLQEAIANNFIGDENWIKYKNSKIEDGIASGMGIQKGGWLHKIISWIAKNFGIGDWMFKRKMNQYFQDAQNLPSNNKNQGQDGQNGQSGSGASTANANPQAGENQGSVQIPPMPENGPTMNNAKKLEVEQQKEIDNIIRNGMSGQTSYPDLNFTDQTAIPKAPPAQQMATVQTTPAQNGNMTNQKNPFEHMKYMNPAYGFRRIAGLKQ